MRTLELFVQPREYKTDHSELNNWQSNMSIPEYLTVSTATTGADEDMLNELLVFVETNTEFIDLDCSDFFGILNHNLINHEIRFNSLAYLPL